MECRFRTNDNTAVQSNLRGYADFVALQSRRPPRRLHVPASLPEHGHGQKATLSLTLEAISMCSCPHRFHLQLESSCLRSQGMAQRSLRSVDFPNNRTNANEKNVNGQGNCKSMTTKSRSAPQLKQKNAV